MLYMYVGGHIYVSAWECICVRTCHQSLFVLCRWSPRREDLRRLGNVERNRRGGKEPHASLLWCRTITEWLWDVHFVWIHHHQRTRPLSTGLDDCVQFLPKYHRSCRSIPIQGSVLEDPERETKSLGRYHTYQIARCRTVFVYEIFRSEIHALRRRCFRWVRQVKWRKGEGGNGGRNCMGRLLGKKGDLRRVWWRNGRSKWRRAIKIGWRVGGREGGRQRGRQGGREAEREAVREGGREGGSEGGRNGGREGEM